MSNEDKRRLINRFALKEVKAGNGYCDVCGGHIDFDSKFSYFSHLDEEKAYLICEDCFKDYKHDVYLSQVTLHCFFNNSSFSKNIEKRLLKRIEELEERVAKLDGGSTKDKGEEIF